MTQENEKLEHLLKITSELSRRFKVIEDFILKSTIEQKAVEISIVNKESTGSISKLAEALNTTDEQLKLILDLDANDFRIIKNIEAAKLPEKQYIMTICILTISNYLFKRDYLPTKDLISQLENHGIDKSNLNRTLKAFTEHVVAKGKKGSSDYVYKITTPGLIKGKEILKQMLKSTN
ncbi:MAG: hypothetical protein IAE93_13605 [Ignavibacteria bacterium]|nr:hypothetical protein [Ignavibacteria bacterium]